MDVVLTAGPCPWATASLASGQRWNDLDSGLGTVGRGGRGEATAAVSWACRKEVPLARKWGAVDMCT